MFDIYFERSCICYKNVVVLSISLAFELKQLKTYTGMIKQKYSLLNIKPFTSKTLYNRVK